MCLLVVRMSSLERMCSDLLPTSKRGSLSFKCPLCILDLSPLSDMHFAYLFSESVTWLFILLTVSVTEHTLFILSELIIFTNHAFGIEYKKFTGKPKIMCILCYLLGIL